MKSSFSKALREGARAVGALALAGVGGAHARACEPDPAAFRRFVATTTSVSKKLVAADRVDSLPGVAMRMAQPLKLELKQAWMTEPMHLSVVRAKVQATASGHLVTYLVREDGKVTVLEGGVESQLPCR